MAHAAGDAHPYPIYGAHYLLTFPMLDADGDLVTGATTPDAEVSKDLGTFTDCTNESTEIATNSGVYYLYLTGAEMTAKIVTVIAKSATAGMKTTVLNLYPIRLPIMESDVAEGGAATTITLAVATASAVNDFYNGMFVYISDNDAAGSQYQARRIIDYVGSTRVATIDSAWGTNPSSSSNYDILIPEGYAAKEWAGGKIVDPASTGLPKVNTTHAAGTAWASGAITTGTFAAGAIDANAIAANAIGASEIADGAIDAATFAAGAITATVIADGAIDAATFAANAITAAKLDPDVTTELQSGLATSAALANVASDVGLIFDTFVATAGTIGSTGNDTTHVHLDVDGNYPDDFFNKHLLVLVDVSAGSDPYLCWITDYVGATSLATVEFNAGALPVTPQNATDTFSILNTVRQDVTTGTGLDAAGVRAAVGLASANLDTQLDALPTNAELATSQAAADDATLAAIALVQTDVDDIQARLPAALTAAGNIKADVEQWLAGTIPAVNTTGVPKIDLVLMNGVAQSVTDLKDFADTGYDPATHKVAGVVLADSLTSVAAAGITASSIATDAIGAAELAADAATEIATAVWASATRTLSALGFTLAASDLAADTITAAKIAADAIGASELATDAVTEIVNAVLTTAMTEAYAADGAAPTLAQMLFMVWSLLAETSISGVTVTSKKLDGSTTAMTFTISDATNPTSITRAT